MSLLCFGPDGTVGIEEPTDRCSDGPQRTVVATESRPRLESSDAGFNYLTLPLATVVTPGSGTERGRGFRNILGHYACGQKLLGRQAKCQQPLPVWWPCLTSLVNCPPLKAAVAGNGCPNYGEGPIQANWSPTPRPQDSASQAYATGLLLRLAEYRDLYQNN